MPAVLFERDLLAMSRAMLLRAADARKEFQQARGTMRRIANTEAKRQVASVYNLSQQRVSDDLKVRPSDAGVVVTGGKRTITFVSYGWRPSRRGLRGRILRGGPTQEFRSGFIARGIGGGQVAFWRTGARRPMQAGRYAGKVRQPVQALHGPSIADALKDSRVGVPLRVRILNRTGEDLQRRLRRIGGVR